MSLAIQSFVFLVIFSKIGIGETQDISKVLVVAGWSNDNNAPTEVIDLVNASNSCQLSKFPATLTWAVGEYSSVDGTIICGGWNPDTYTDLADCYLMDANSSEFTNYTQLSTQRSFASSVMLQNGSLLVLGGRNEDFALKSTELVSESGVQASIDLPTPLYGHCTAKINDTMALIAGGFNGISLMSSTYFLDLVTLSITEGPPLREARRRHGCTAFMHNGMRLVIVAGGSYPYLKTVELLNLDSDSLAWISGEPLPSTMDDIPLMATSVGVLAFGGFNPSSRNRYTRNILKLNLNNPFNPRWDVWQHTSLSIGQSASLVIPIPDSFAICDSGTLDLLDHVLVDEDDIGTNQTLPSSTTLSDDCSYCPECARVIHEEHEHVGGSSRPVSIDEWPWMAGIGYEEGKRWENYCGGAVISNYTVLTAAHCFFSNSSFDFVKRNKTKIRLGDQRHNDQYDVLAKTYEINTVIGHPKYLGRGPKHDLAIVFTKEPIMFNPRIKPVCIPTVFDNTPDKYSGEDVKFAGYGFYDSMSPFSNFLREANFRVLSESNCLNRNLYHRRRNDKDLFFCAGHVNDRTWTCRGDSGSPLIKQTNSSCYKLIGVLHGGKSSCGNPKAFPSMFASVEHRENFDFIHQWKNSFEDLTKLLKNQEDITKVVNYTTNINPVDETGNAILSNEDLSHVFFVRCCFNNPETQLYNLKNYGVNCSMVEEKFACQNGAQYTGYYIFKNRQCNRIKKCLDGSDKSNCSPRQIVPPFTPSTAYGQCKLPIVPDLDPDITSCSGLRFGNSPGSLLEFTKRIQLRKRSNFGIEFKTSKSNGVIFYIADEKNSDFIALFVKNGKLVYGFNCGSGPVYIESNQNVDDKQWHFAEFSRQTNVGKLYVDGTLQSESMAVGPAMNIEVSEVFHLGGLPEDYWDNPVIRRNFRNVLNGFVGCLKEMLQHGNPIGKWSKNRGVVPCSDKVEPGYFFGPDGGFILASRRYRVGLDFGISMQIKPRNISGLVLAIQGRKDYLILQIVDGTMTFQVDNGRGPITATFKPEDPFQFCDGNWHQVHAIKAKNVVTFSVDNIFARPGIGVPGVSSTNTNHGLFIGGHPRADRLTGLKTSNGYVGCIKNIAIENEPLDVTARMLKGDIQSNVCPTI